MYGKKKNYMGTSGKCLQNSYENMILGPQDIPSQTSCDDL